MTKFYGKANSSKVLFRVSGYESPIRSTNENRLLWPTNEFLWDMELQHSKNAKEIICIWKVRPKINEPTNN